MNSKRNIKTASKRTIRTKSSGTKNSATQKQNQKHPSPTSQSPKQKSINTLFAYIAAILAISYKWINRQNISLAANLIQDIIPYEFQFHNPKHGKIEDFLQWLVENDAIISNKVTVAQFEDYGGFGLLAIEGEGERNGNGNGNVNAEPYAIQALDEMFTIPGHIITSVQSVYAELKLINPRLQPELEEKLEQHMANANPLAKQDVVIAMKFVLECSLGKRSKFKPYLDILPQQIIPRLDTFRDEEYMILQDPFLVSIGKESRKRLERFWDDDGVQKVMVDMINGGDHSDEKRRNGNMHGKRRKRHSQGTRQNIREDNVNVDAAKCLDFTTFHRFVTIVSSRAMILNDEKFLTPLSGMLNYKPRSEERIKGKAPHPFHLFHARNQEDGSITVRAGRDVIAGHQIFEDYGDLDNSLYLEAFGFVPHHNPFHCASIPAKYLPTPHELASKGAGLGKIMVRLGIVPPSPNAWDMYVPDICVKADGSVDDDENGYAMKYLTLAALSESQTSLKRCSNSNTSEGSELNCFHYPGKNRLIKGFITKLANDAFCDHRNPVQHDEAMLNTLQSDRGTHSKTLNSIVALKFVIAEKHTLSKIASVNFSDCATTGNNRIYNLSESTSTLDLFDSLANDSQNLIIPELDSKKVEEFILAFNSFIDDLDVPIRKIRAAHVGDMRIGAIATEDIKEGEVYFSALSSTSVIDVDSAEIDDQQSMAKAVLESIKESNSGDGGFRAVLFYLLHEKLVMKEKSKWFPYLQILPTVEDLNRSSPIFFDDTMFDYLAGSDLRWRLIRLKKEVMEEFHYFSNNVTITKALGFHNLSWENFAWAYAVIQQHSIWWNGKRHLSPLLDLVNCAEILNAKGHIARSRQVDVDGTGYARTQASASFKRGDEVFENYFQPNHEYFIEHGFSLKDNSQDCVLIDTIGGLERSSETMHRMNKNTHSPSFCIRDARSLGDLSNFIRIHQGNKDLDNMDMANDVTILVKEELERRLNIYGEIGDRFESRHELPRHPIETMKSIVNNEILTMRTILNELQWSTGE